MLVGVEPDLHLGGGEDWEPVRGLVILAVSKCGILVLKTIFIAYRPHWFLCVWDLNEEPVAILAPPRVPVVNEECGTGQLHLAASSFQLKHGSVL